VVILTTSEAEADIVKCYDMGANCYVSKPVGFAEFTKIVSLIEEFWFTIVKKPPKKAR
jgi:DNA-binding NarL/FixJ family response regulator